MVGTLQETPPQSKASTWQDLTFNDSAVPGLFPGRQYIPLDLLSYTGPELSVPTDPAAPGQLTSQAPPESPISREKIVAIICKLYSGLSTRNGRAKRWPNKTLRRFLGKAFGDLSLRSAFSCDSLMNFHKSLFSKDFICVCVCVFFELQIQLYSILILLCLRAENTAQL